MDNERKISRQSISCRKCQQYTVTVDNFMLQVEYDENENLIYAQKIFLYFCPSIGTDGEHQTM